MTKNIEFKIDGMSCGSCAKGVEGAIKNVDGVETVEVSFDTKTAKVQFDEDKTCEVHVFKAVEAMDYKVVK